MNESASVSNPFDKLKSDLSLNEKYTDMVDEYVKKKSPIVFGNSSLGHATYINARMLEHATEDVFILSGTMTELYFEKIIPFIKLAVRKVKSIKIITVQEFDKKRIDDLKKTFASLNEETNEETNHVIQYLALRNNGSPEAIYHFSVVDGKAWRKESPHSVKLYNEEIRAEVCFNDFKRGIYLQLFFKTIWDKFSAKSST